MEMCKRCILSEDFPNIVFDSKGICNYCHEWDKKWKGFDYEKAERRLRIIFKWAKKKKRLYDCLIPFSGGRDSSYVAWICKNNYKLEPLLVTFNNLFLSEYGLQNILRTTEVLNCDHIMLSFHPKLLKTFYRTMLLKAGEFCSVCACGINYAVITLQKRYNIPLVVWGRGSRVDENSPFDIICSHPLYVRKVLSSGGIDLRDISKFLVKRPNEWSLQDKIKAKINGTDYIQINLPDFLPWKIKEIEKTLKREIGWQTPDDEKDHIDCKFVSVKTYLKNKQVPHFIFKQEKFSQLIRDGQMSRGEALRKLNRLIKSENGIPNELKSFMEILEISQSDIEKVSDLSHKRFIELDETIVRVGIIEKNLNALWNLVKFRI